MAIAAADALILRNLAKRLAEKAALPEQAEKIRLWKGFNALRPERPMVLAFPEGGWRDLITEDELHCQGKGARKIEMSLQQRLFMAEHIHDDVPATAFWNVGPALKISDFGMHHTMQRTQDHGAATWDAPIKTPDDVKKLRPRTYEYDRSATQRNLEEAEKLFSDILTVRQRHGIGWPAALSMSLIFLRGLEQVMIDLYDNPQMIHEIMAYLRDEEMAKLDWLESQGLLSLNNGPDDYVGSGGLGGTDELPGKDFDGYVRPMHLWGFGESQEFVGVSPSQWEEFVLAYQLPILQRFGLNHYGCCEPLDRKYDALFARVPRLRRLSISPWCDRALAAQRLGKKYIFSWKPAPSMICAPHVNWEEVETYIRDTARFAKGCALEMIMKDTHTFCGDKTRIERWSLLASRIARGE